MARDLAGKSILITGGSSGIGAATGIACAKAGMRVALAARRRDRLEEVVSQIRSDHGEAVAITCDVARDDDVARAVDDTLTAFGSLDVLFANAGFGVYSTVLETPPDQARELFETNFWGTVRCIRAAVPVMQQQPKRGQIVICSSACSEIGLPMYGFYAATKAAQDSIGGSLRAEVAELGISVTTVHPIGTTSDFFPTIRDRFSPPGDGLNTPPGMMQSPEHVARRIVRGIAKRHPEVWPSRVTRLGLAMTTASPKLGAWVIRRMHARRDTQTPPPGEPA